MGQHREEADLRRYARFEIFEYAMIHTMDEADPLATVIVDVSLGGLQTRSKTEFIPGQMCLMKIGQGGNQPIEVQAEVRYSILVEDSQLYATGFKFHPRTPQERLVVVNYVHQVFRRRGHLLV